MKKGRVGIIGMNQPLDYDTHFRKRLDNSKHRALRHASRIPGIDLPAIQQRVNENFSRLQLRMNGKYMGLLDLMNYVKNSRKLPVLSLDNADRYLTHSDMITLNGIYLYQYLRNEGYDPFVIQNYSLVDLCVVLEERPLAVGISSNFLFLDEILNMAADIKEHDPSIPVIAGGILVKKVLNTAPNISSETLHWLSTFRGKVDVFVVEFQGEQTLVRVLEKLRAGGDLKEVPNLAFFDEKGEMVLTRREPEQLDINQTMIHWDSIPREYLRKTLPVTSSRGCTYRCRFCTMWRLCPQVHYKSMEVLRDELRRIQNLGFVRHVRFTDDNFTGNKKRLGAVLEMMIEERFDFSWSAYARASSLSSEIVGLMKTAGCDFVNMGIESGSQTVLNNMDKRLKREDVVDAIGWLNDQEIYAEGGFIIGFPGETTETFAETVDLISSCRLPYYQPNLFYYSKDMLVSEDRDKFGLVGLATAWRHNTMDAVKASQLMVQMIKTIEYGFNEPQVSLWETFRLLRAAGYSPQDIYELVKLKRALKLAVEENPYGQGTSETVEGILKELEAIVGDH